MNNINNYNTLEKQQLVRDQLVAGVVKLMFQRNDGTVRHMRATLNENHLPPRDPTNHAGPPVPELQVVWDLEANGWRSFKWERLILAEV
jgi:hypothetical protein